MNIKLNLPLVASVLAAIAGIVGTTLVPILGTSLATSVQAVLQALSGVLLAIPVYHTTAVAASTAKVRAAARLAK